MAAGTEDQPLVDQADEAAPRKIIMITEVTAEWNRMADFNTLWEQRYLPYWTANGAIYLGSFAAYLGDATNKTLRIFMFPSLSTYNAFMEQREAMFESQSGVQSMEAVFSAVKAIRETVWKATSG